MTNWSFSSIFSYVIFNKHFKCQIAKFLICYIICRRIKYKPNQTVKKLSKRRRNWGLNIFQMTPTRYPLMEAC